MFSEIRSRRSTGIIFYIYLAASAVLVISSVVMGILGYRIYQASGAFPTGDYIFESIKNGAADSIHNTDSAMDYMASSFVAVLAGVSFLLIFVIHEILTFSDSPVGSAVTLVGMIGFLIAALILDGRHGLAHKDLIVGLTALAFFGCGFVHFVVLGSPRLFLFGAMPALISLIAVPVLVRVAIVGVVQALGTVAGYAIVGVMLYGFLVTPVSTADEPTKEEKRKAKIKNDIEALDRNYRSNKNALRKKREGSLNYCFVDEKTVQSDMRKNRAEHERLMAELIK